MENAHVSQRGLFLFGWLGNCGTSENDKNKIPRFFMLWSQRNQISKLPLGLGQKKD